MTGVSVNPLTTPGTAALTFKALQDAGRFDSVLVALRAVRVMHNLPKVAWSVDSGYGVTGRVRGADDNIVDCVWAWADAFAVKAVVEAAYEDSFRSRTFLIAGFAVVQLLPGVTVGGRLVDPEAGR